VIGFVVAVFLFRRGAGAAAASERRGHGGHRESVGVLVVAVAAGRAAAFGRGFLGFDQAPCPVIGVAVGPEGE
jgi:hypothetical protein